VIGINTAIVASGQGIGFAIPINMAKDVLPELKDNGEVARGWLGVAIQEVTPEIARAVGLKEPKGAMVTSVYAGDPAGKAGIKAGDVILKINEHEVADPRDLTRLIGSLKPNDKVIIGVFRDGRTIELTAKLEKRRDEHVVELEKGPSKNPEGVKDRLGLVVVDITAQVQQEYNLGEAAGVLVIDVDPKGSGAKSQIQKMDVIREADRHEVKTVKEYLAAISGKKKGQTVLLLIMRGSKPLYVAADIE
jgi:serine protease Do